MMAGMAEESISSASAIFAENQNFMVTGMQKTLIFNGDIEKAYQCPRCNRMTAFYYDSYNNGTEQKPDIRHVFECSNCDLFFRMPRGRKKRSYINMNDDEGFDLCELTEIASSYKYGFKPIS